MDQLQQIFRPHQFGDTRYVDLYHVYDNLSQTPFLHGDGISCGDPDDYIMNAWHVIMPLAMRRHLNWQNRISTQFISFYNNEADARREAQRRVNQRWVPGVGDNEPTWRERSATSVRVAHVRLPHNTNVWAFSRQEMLNMVGALDNNTHDIFATSGTSEWFVWGSVPEHLVVNQHEL